jgi:hypothetical protein
MNEYITKDLGEAAALLTFGLVMRDMQWKDGKAYFLFLEPDKCTTTAHQYFFEGLNLNVRMFYENLKMVKRKLYNEQNKGGDRRYVQSKKPSIQRAISNNA